MELQANHTQGNRMGYFTDLKDDLPFDVQASAQAIPALTKESVIAMHYGSNPLTKGTFAEFAEAMKGSTTRVVPITEGQMVEF